MLQLWKKQVATPYAYSRAAFRDLLQLTTYFLLNNNIYTHTHTCTHTHTHVYIGALFCCKLQQMAARLDALSIQTIFALVLTVAPSLSCNNYERSKSPI